MFTFYALQRRDPAALRTALHGGGNLQHLRQHFPYRRIEGAQG